MFLQSKSLWQNTTGQLCFSKTLWRSSISSLSFALLGACFSNLKGKYNTHMWEFHSQKPHSGKSKSCPIQYNLHYVASYKLRKPSKGHRGFSINYKWTNSTTKTPLSPKQIDATLLAKNSKHCWMFHVASVCSPCSMLLCVVEPCLKPVKCLAKCKRTWQSINKSIKSLAQQCWELLGLFACSLTLGISKLLVSYSYFCGGRSKLCTFYTEVYCLDWFPLLLNI